MGMTPFWTQIINFATIILGSGLSTFLVPVLCHKLTEPLAVVLIDSTASVFYLVFMLI